MNIESYYRKPVNYISEDLSFQTIEWVDSNESIEDSTESDNESETESENEQQSTILNDEKYIIRAFGVTKEGYSVCLNIEDFTPFFYIKVSSSWTKNHISQLLSQISDKLIIKRGNSWVKCSENLLKDKCIIQSKKDFFGFSNNETFKFLRLVFNNSIALKRCINIIKNHNKNIKKLSGFGDLPLYEANVDSIIRFIHIRDLKFSGWLTAKNVRYVEDNGYRMSNCQIEATVNWKYLNPLKNDNTAPLLQASYDIETYSDDGSFPSPSKPLNVITQIATTFKYFGQDDFYMKHIICLKKCSPIQSLDSVPIFLECYDTEKEVLFAWKRLLINMDPDILYQYNGDWFDGHYLDTRAKLLKCDKEFLHMSKLRHINAELVNNKFSSSAYGSSNFRRLIIPGRINFDILVYIRREYKENSYKLDFIAEKYLGQKKNPVTPQMMFQYFKEGDPDKIREVAHYCIKDTMLPQLLVDKLCILQNQLAMSNITYVPIKYLLEKGQQIKVFSQILKETRSQNFLIPTFDRNYDEIINKELDLL